MSLPIPLSLSFQSWKKLEESLPLSSIYTSDNRQQLVHALETRWQTPHGDCKRWQGCVDSLPFFSSNSAQTNSPKADDIHMLLDDVVSVSFANPSQEDCSSSKESIERALMGLSPWRKGPFNVFDVYIDSEWRSDWKWKRIQENGLLPLFQGANVLDIGCGNGYYGWRMLEAGAQSVLGIDGSMLLLFQFAVCKRYSPFSPLLFFPLRFELLPQSIKGFEVVSSMGVLSHHKAPILHLKEMRQRLIKGGSLILETLIIEDENLGALYPQDRYAKMNNVFALPSPNTLTQWLKEAGFKDIVVHDVSRTTSEEQRPTPWMGNQSLEHFLNPHNSDETIEGHPAPTRLLLSARY